MAVQVHISEKSPSPQPFIEPDNMTTIDLNKTDHFSAENVENKPAKKFKVYNIIKSLVVVIGLFILLGLCVTILILLIHRGHSKNIIALNESAQVTETSFEVLFSNKERITACKTSKSFQDCCYIFFKANAIKDIKKCTVHKVLNLFLQYELEANRRSKRQNYYSDVFYDEQMYPPDYGQENGYNDDTEYPNNFDIDNYYQHYNERLDIVATTDYYPEYNGEQQEHPPYSYHFQEEERSAVSPSFGDLFQTTEITTFAQDAARHTAPDTDFLGHYMPNEKQNYQDQTTPHFKPESEANAVVSATTPPKLCSDDKCPSGDIANVKAEADLLKISLNDTKIKLVPETRQNARITQGNSFDIQTRGDMLTPVPNKQVSPCFYSVPPLPPYGAPPGYNPSPVFGMLPMSPNQQSLYVINPPIYPSLPMPYPGYNFPQTPQVQTTKSAVQVVGKGGQYYLCNPVFLPAVKGIELRHTTEAFNLQDLLQSMPDIPKSNRTREALDCPFGTRACNDNSKCVHKRLLCDNEVNCNDASDEMDCSCKKRVGEIRWCDGYLDCPNGEDEEDCFDCSSDEISCDDWSRFQRGTCVPISQRCDGIKQCEITGKDEEDCSILTDRLGQHSFYQVSNAAGFLHRSYKGKWYPTCFGADAFSLEVCRTEAGPTEVMPRTHLVQTNDNYPGPFLDLSPTDGITLADDCMRNKAAFVECPPLYCGLRLTINNPFRATEVDTSAEEFLTRLRSFRRSQDPVLGESRVVGGKPSQPTAWPWIVSIYKNGVFHCGGVLINDLWILTAAHCVDRFWVFYYEIQAGILRRFSYSPMEQTRWATVAIPHEDYNKKSLKNDIALMKLSKPVRFNRYVRPICLPSESTAGADYLRGPKPSTICITVGWGATVEHGTDPDHLREVEIPILAHCKHTEDQEGDEICAGLSEGGRDACQGDSGGPLMCQNGKNRSQWYLAGIVSHGEGCARPDEPGVYTKVSKYIGWISENINGKAVGRFPLQKCPGYVCVGTRKCIPKKRHCDKIVDCLFGDDETDCWSSSSDFRSTLVGSGLNFFNHSDNTVTINSLEEKVYESNRTISTIPVGDHFEATLNTTLESEDGILRSSEVYLYCGMKRYTLEEKCDKAVDCEDGKDELNCSCVDYLVHVDKEAKCDGVIDCKDMSDETDCERCSEKQYLCRSHQKCIPLEKRCDGQTDCISSEDEWDCVALTDGKTLVFDSDLRPKHSMKGIITINRFGVWRPLCSDASVDDAASIATNVCNLLGFEEYTVFHKLSVADKPLNVTIDGFERRSSSLDDPPQCNGLFLACSNVSLDNMRELVNVTSQEKLTFAWNAMIYLDGEFRCTGTVLTPHFIITTKACFQNPLQTDGYMTALLGKQKAHLDVEGPHDQIVVINEIAFVGETEAAFLHTEEKINFNRYIKPARITAKSRFVKEQCVAIGFQGKKSKAVVLEPEKDCTVGFRCFKTSVDKCENGEFGLWKGVVTCTSKEGWYVAAVYSGIKSPCDFEGHTFASISEDDAKTAMGSDLKTINSSVCEGFRCNLGQCLGKNKVCNKIPDCRSGEDEDTELCTLLESECHLSSNCTKLPSCELSKFRCPNGKCIDKNFFCDRTDDCDDGYDEPQKCTCTTFVQTVYPEKMCDGILNCFDKSDEDPQICKCQNPRGVPCGQSGLCVAEGMVCDGIKQCPEGEDESHCLSLQTNSPSINSGEVLRRTSGVWHSGCFAKNHTAIELESICKELGFSGAAATQLVPPEGVSNIAKKPLLEFPYAFYMFSPRGTTLRMFYRTGNQPYVTFVDSSNCYKLFIECNL